MSADETEILPAALSGPPAVTIAPPHFQWPIGNEESEAAVVAMVRSGELSYGRVEGKVKELEDNFKQHMGLDYAISAHSGTGAIHAGWFGLNLAPGTEVIVPAYTHIGTAMPLFHLGLVPVLCDVDLETGNIDPAQIEASITNRTGAIGVTHQFGLSADMGRITEIADRFNLKILEDCSHAHGSTSEGRPVGVRGDVACFSLQSHKTISVGEGGILLTSDARIAERAALLGHYRLPHEYSSEEFAELVETGYGMKSRLHPLAAAIGVVSLKNIGIVCEQRDANYRLLASLVDPIPGLAVLATPSNCTRGGHFRFVLKFNPQFFAGLTAARVVEAIVAEGALEVRSGAQARCLHSFKIFQDKTFSVFGGNWLSGSDPLANRPFYHLGDFPNAESFSANTIQMPAFTEPSQEVLGQYAKAFAKVQAHAHQF